MLGGDCRCSSSLFVYSCGPPPPLPLFPVSDFIIRGIIHRSILPRSNMRSTEDGDEEATDNCPIVDPAIIPIVPPHLPLERMSWKQSIQRRMQSWIHLRYATPWRLKDASQRGPEESNMGSAQLGVDSIISSTSSSIGSGTSQIINNGGPSTATSIPEAPSFQDISQRPINPTNVKLFKRLKGARVYLAEGDDAKIPSDIMEQWNTKDFGRLMTDLTEVTMDIYRKSIDRGARSHVASKDHNVFFELRMSGRAPRDARCITLVPSVWILCGSRWACKDVKAAMNDITWLKLPLEVHEGSPELASVEETMDVNILDLTNGIQLAEDITLYINIEIPSHDATTASGLLCCSTIRAGDTYLHHIGRIGGAISINGTAAQYGVTTAHGMLNNLPVPNQFVIQPCKSTLSESPPSEVSDSDITISESEVDDEDDEETSSDNDSDMEDQDVMSLDYAGFRDPLLVSEWCSVSTGTSLNFLGASFQSDYGGTRYYQPDQSPSRGASKDIDHALLPLKTAAGFAMPSSYTIKSPTPTKRGQVITGFKRDADLVQGPVTIELGVQPKLKGELLPGSTCLAVHGQVFSLRKVKFASRLASGTSGSWVVRKSFLCGMIMAVSRTEPYALMMTAERLFRNIKSCDWSIHRIEFCASHETKNPYESSYPEIVSVSGPQVNGVLPSNPYHLGIMDVQTILKSDEHLRVRSMRRQHTSASWESTEQIIYPDTPLGILPKVVLTLSSLALVVSITTSLAYHNRVDFLHLNIILSLILMVLALLSLLMMFRHILIGRLFRESGYNLTVVGLILTVIMLLLVIAVMEMTRLILAVLPVPTTVSGPLLTVLLSLLLMIVVWFISFAVACGVRDANLLRPNLTNRSEHDKDQS
ncbi:hypothetical protein EDB80DRAFT_702654 [Ilyonectria destructans]|nr:hypothetical protein EDB80DRAFT_702654 [Ilyonectria destructans]